MSKANFLGRKVALPGSKRYKSLPRWVLDPWLAWRRDHPNGAPSCTWLSAPDHGEGVTVPQAEAMGFNFAELYLMAKRQDSNGSIKRRIGKAKRATGGNVKDGIRELGGEQLDTWRDYEITQNGAMLRHRMFSKKQLVRAKEARTRQADDVRNALIACVGWTDYDCMRKFPDVFAKRAMAALGKTEEEIANLTNEELRPYRPGTLTGYREKCRHLPEGRVHSWKEHGVLFNKIDHINTVVSRLRALATKIASWNDPVTGVKHIPTWKAIEKGMSEQELTRCTMQPTAFLVGDEGGKGPSDNDNVFHPHATRLVVDTISKPSRLWPEHEIDQYLERQKEFHQARKAAADAARAAAKAFLAGLIQKGPVRASQGMRLFRRKFPLGLFYEVRESAGILFGRVQQKKTRFGVWRLEGQDLGSLQDLTSQLASLAGRSDESTKYPGHAKKQRTRGPKPNPYREVVLEYCYDRYVVEQWKAKNVIDSCPAHFGNAATKYFPKKKQDVRDLVREWSSKFSPPLPLNRQEN